MTHDCINSMVLDIVAKYGKSAIRRSIMSLRNGDKIIRKAFGGKDIKRIVEIGTFRGLTTAFMAKEFDCEVYTIDKKTGQVEEMLDECTVTREAIWDTVGVTDKIKAFTINGNHEKWHVLNGIDWQFNAAFIDGHEDDTLNDFNLLRRCGLVLFHDVKGGRPAIKRVIAELEKSGKIDYISNDETDADVFAIWTK